MYLQLYLVRTNIVRLDFVRIKLSSIFCHARFHPFGHETQLYLTIYHRYHDTILVPEEPTKRNGGLLSLEPIVRDFARMPWHYARALISKTRSSLVGKRIRLVKTSTSFPVLFPPLVPTATTKEGKALGTRLVKTCFCRKRKFLG